jgi:hypothetical protein
VRWPVQVGSIPLLADCYQRRERETGLIGDALVGGVSTGLPQVLSGLGGVGKTQLAAGYAHAAWRDARVDLVMWVTASSREAIQASYAQAAREITTVVPVEAEQSAAWFVGWLQSTPRPWLIVVDDLGIPRICRACGRSDPPGVAWSRRGAGTLSWLAAVGELSTLACTPQARRSPTCGRNSLPRTAGRMTVRWWRSRRMWVIYRWL